MKEIRLNAKSTDETVRQIQQHIGGTITERFGEFTLQFDNDIAKGCIRFITFDWGVSLIEYNLIFFEDILFIADTSEYNPIHFIYCSKGCMRHRFSYEEEFNTISEFHSAIFTSKENTPHHTLFPKGLHLEINVISISRRDFLKKRLNNVEQLNEKLYEVFTDVDSNQEFAYFSPIHLKMEDHVKALLDIDTQGMTRVLQMEGEVYQLLSMHITRHDKYAQNDIVPNTLLTNELKVIRRYAQKILDDFSINYTLDQLSKDSGLSQAKLQEGFKFLYTRTVTEYIRHVRLEAARDLMNNSDLNISQIVYSIGFTSRSYFSKIFKEKYGITPHEYKKQIIMLVEFIE
ncbi:MAG: AraC family transcriptional regulator [Aquaticitalea sp.]